MVQVVASSGLWEVMTSQEAVDFVHQCRLCRPDNISCSEALTLEAHTRWKLNFSKVANSSNAASPYLPLCCCYDRSSKPVINPARCHVKCIGFRSALQTALIKSYCWVRIAGSAHAFLLLGIAGKVDCQHRLLQGCYMWAYMLILLNSLSPCCSVLPAGDC